MGAEPPAAIAEIRQHARRTLAIAGADGESYVDLDQVTTAVGLRKADLYTPDNDVPETYRSLLKTLGSKVLGLLAIPEKTIYVDSSMPDGRRRFTEAHEIGHDVLPWHEGAFYHDDDTTLAASTRDELEQEANVFSSELLFGAGTFTRIADDYAPGLAVPLDLATRYGASAAAALRYYAEWSQRPVAVIALSQYQTNRDGTPHIRVINEQSFTSQSFAAKYGTIDTIFPTGSVTPANGAFHLAAESTTTGVGAMGDVQLTTTRGSITLHAEVFNNSRLRYLVLTRRSRLQGRRKELVGPDGRPLLRAL